MTFEVFGSHPISENAVSESIMDVTASDFSHSGIIVNGDTIYHATIEDDFHVIALEEFLKSNVIVHRFAVKVSDIGFTLGWLTGSLGKEYSMQQFPGILLRAFRWLGRNKRARLICSEAVIWFGIDCCGLQFDKEPDFTSPKRALAAMKAVAA